MNLSILPHASVRSSPVSSRAVGPEDPAEESGGVVPSAVTAGLGSPDLPSAGASVGWPLAADEVADDVGVASFGSPLALGVGSPLAVVLVGEALVDVESLALAVADADAVLEMASLEGDAEAEGSAVGAGVGTEPDAAMVVVCEVDVTVLTVTLEPLGEAKGELAPLAALKAAISAGVSRTVTFSTTFVVSLMVVAGSRFT